MIMHSRRPILEIEARIAEGHRPGDLQRGARLPLFCSPGAINGGWPQPSRSRQSKLPHSADTSGKPREAQPLTELTVVLADWRKSTSSVALVLISMLKLCSEDAVSDQRISPGRVTWTRFSARIPPKTRPGRPDQRIHARRLTPPMSRRSTPEFLFRAEQDSRTACAPPRPRRSTLTCWPSCSPDRPAGWAPACGSAPCALEQGGLSSEDGTPDMPPGV
jgi:hypothetical protein